MFRRQVVSTNWVHWQRRSRQFEILSVTFVSLPIKSKKANKKLSDAYFPFSYRSAPSYRLSSVKTFVQQRISGWIEKEEQRTKDWFLYEEDYQQHLHRGKNRQQHDECQPYKQERCQKLHLGFISLPLHQPLATNRQFINWNCKFALLMYACLDGGEIKQYYA